MANKVQQAARKQEQAPRQESQSPVAEQQGTNENAEAPASEAGQGDNDLVAEGQQNDPNVPDALDKDGPANDITAPGEASGIDPTRVHVRAKGAYLVYDPYTADTVGQEGGEMRLTTFVKEQLEDGGRLERI